MLIRVKFGFSSGWKFTTSGFFQIQFLEQAIFPILYFRQL